MTTSRIGSARGLRALVAALAIAGGLGAATVAEAASAFAQPGLSEGAGATPVQYWGDHGDWGHRRHHHHHHDRGYGHRHHGHGRDHGWGHRHGGWGHRDHGWGHRHHGHHHHHHRGHGRYDY